MSSRRGEWGRQQRGQERRQEKGTEKGKEMGRKWPRRPNKEQETGIVSKRHNTKLRIQNSRKRGEEGRRRKRKGVGSSKQGVGGLNRKKRLKDQNSMRPPVVKLEPGERKRKPAGRRSGGAVYFTRRRGGAGEELPSPTEVVDKVPVASYTAVKLEGEQEELEQEMEENKEQEGALYNRIMGLTSKNYSHLQKVYNPPINAYVSCDWLFLNTFLIIKFSRSGSRDRRKQRKVNVENQTKNNIVQKINKNKNTCYMSTTKPTTPTI